MEDTQDAGLLKFDLIWKTAQCLNICEVEQLLRGPALQQSSQKGQLESAFKHARRFARLRDSQSLQELRITLEEWEAQSAVGDNRLSPFEVAQLVNLVPSDVDEAKALIPSLDRFSPVDIGYVLETIQSFMKTGTGGGFTQPAAISH